MTKLPPFLQPRLRLFLGADIVGSTALKQTRGAHSAPVDQAKSGPAWFSAIQGFYFESAQAFLLDWERSKARSEEPSRLYGPPPRFWKTVGDEVLFVKEVSDHRQVAVTLHVWMRAIRRMKEFLKTENSSLDVKATGWTAGFPFRNREIVLDTSPSLDRGTIENYYRESGRLLNQLYTWKKRKPRISVDYIGPSIDTGFRLAAFSTGRKMTVSVDVAYLVAMTQFDGEVQRIDFFYDGSVTLKGVFGGSNYPLFWVDMSEESSLARCEDKMKAQNTVAKEDIKEYCDAFYKEHSDFTFRPFIEGDVGETLARKPGWYDDYQQRLAENFSNPETEDNKGDEEAASVGEEADKETLNSMLEQLSSTMTKGDEED